MEDAWAQFEKTGCIERVTDLVEIGGDHVIRGTDAIWTGSSPLADPGAETEGW